MSAGTVKLGSEQRLRSTGFMERLLLFATGPLTGVDRAAVQEAVWNRAFGSDPAPTLEGWRKGVISGWRGIRIHDALFVLDKRAPLSWKLSPAERCVIEGHYASTNARFAQDEVASFFGKTEVPPLPDFVQRCIDAATVSPTGSEPYSPR